jgi:transposase
MHRRDRHLERSPRRSCFTQRDERSFANDANGLRELIRLLKPLSPEHIVFEATGAYHRLLERR